MSITLITGASRGVGEALDETDCGCRVPDCPKCPPLTARGLHSLVLAGSAQPRREAQQYHQDPIVLAFQEVKASITEATTLAFSDFNKPFEIHTDASEYQLGAVISQDNQPIAFYSKF